MAGINAPGIDIIGVETAHSLLDGLGIPAAPTAPPPRFLTRSRRRLGFGMTMIAVVFFVGFLAVGGLDEITSLRQESSYVGSTPTLDTSAPPFSIAVGERRAPDGRTCADVQFGKVPPRLVPVSSAGDGRLASSRLAGLCGLRFSVVWPPSTLHGAAYLAVESGRYIEGVDTDRSVGAIVPIKPDSPWDVDLPWHLGNAFVYRIVIAAGAERVDAALDALRETADWDKAVASMAERGITVLTLSHRVDP